MEPAERHKIIIQKVLEMVKKDKPQAYSAMVEKDSLKKGISNPGALQSMGDYAGFMAMDTAMTNNWHQPVQSIGSSKGDGVVFKHIALVCFKSTHSHQPLKSIRSVDPSKDYVVDIAKDEVDQFPVANPEKLAMLIAQHSASIPDTLSITYSAMKNWNKVHLGNQVCVLQCMKRGGGGGGLGANALVALSTCGGGGLGKRKWSSSCSNSTCSTPRSTPAAMGIGTTSTPLASTVRKHVPEWVMKGMANAVHRYTIGRKSFTENNFSQVPSNLDERGVPDIARTTVNGEYMYTGISFSVKDVPCIVAAAVDGILKVHDRNFSFLWVGKKDDRVLVYMKCWDPDCQCTLKKQDWRKGLFDNNGWARLDKKGMKAVWDI